MRLLPLSLSLAAAHAAAAAAQEAGAKYVPSPYTPGWEVWFGAVAAAVPFVLGSWEFGKRILIQRRCARCEGSGLVLAGRTQQRSRKCPDCGGFFPWQGWRRFLTSTAAPGNGGPLRAPKGQTSVFYKVPETRPKSEAPGGSGSGSSSSERSRDEATG